VSQGQKHQDWTDLERRFFEAAPPDEPLVPPPALTFDDLEDPARPRRRRVAQRPRRQAKSPRFVWARPALRAFAPVVTRARSVGSAVWAVARPTVGRAFAATGRTLRPLLSRIVSRLLSRLLAEIPGERLEGRTIIVGLVTMAVVLGLSASVLGSRGNDWLAPPPAVATTPAAAPKCPASEAPGPLAVVQPLEPEVRRHVVAPAVPVGKHPRHVKTRKSVVPR
jgi:hypothetical protein